MGMWYETCMVTNLPIKPDEEVVGFLLVVHDRGRASEPSFCVQPASLPLYGVYDGYGGLSYEGSEAVERFSVSYIEQKRTRHESVMGQFGGGGLPDPLTLNTVIQEAERSTTRDDTGIYVGVGAPENEWRLAWTLVHRFAFDSVVESVSSLVGEPWIVPREKLERNASVIFPVEDAHPEDRWITTIGTTGATMLFFIQEMELSLVPREHREELRQPFVDLMMFVQGLRLLRKPWLPQGEGKGSQENHLALHGVLARSILGYVDPVR